MSEAIVSTPAVALEDYIITIDNTNPQSVVSYEVVLENNTDFIVRRQTKKGEKELVILISKGLYYIRDCNNGGVSQVTNRNLCSFLRDLKDNCIGFQQVNWIGALFKDSADFIVAVTGDPILSDMCKHNMPISPENPKKHMCYWKQNKKLYKKVIRLFSRQSTVTEKYQNSIPVIFWIEEHYGHNEAIYFAEQVIQSGVRNMSFNLSYQYDEAYKIEGFTQIMESEYNINLRRFTNYICFDLYQQGYGDINGSFFREYFNYLTMQKTLYGKVREKYPKHFKTAYDVISLKDKLAEIAERSKDFAEQAKQIKSLEYSALGYCIVVPTELKELADEGANLRCSIGNCIDQVASGECQVLFLRRKNTPEQSLVTLQLCGQSIYQARGIDWRNITQEERIFLYNWGQEKNITIAVWRRLLLETYFSSRSFCTYPWQEEIHCLDSNPVAEHRFLMIGWHKEYLSAKEAIETANELYLLEEDEAFLSHRLLCVNPKGKYPDKQVFIKIHEQQWFKLKF